MKAIEMISSRQYRWNGREDYHRFRNLCTLKIIESSRRVKISVSVAQPLIPDLPLQIAWYSRFSGLQGRLEVRNRVLNRHSRLLLALTSCFGLSWVGWNRWRAPQLTLSMFEICLKYEAIYATDERLESRRYILDLLSNRIEPLFPQKLGVRVCPHLK